MYDNNTILVTGGAGYVGSMLVPLLLNSGYKVRVIDLYIYGENVFNEAKDNINLTEVKDDIRNKKIIKEIIKDCDSVIHLACISNDPSYELDPELSKSINYDAFKQLVDISKNSGVKRFIYASSSSVYGIKKEQEVTEDLSLMPLTDYSKYKALCEEYLQKAATNEFTVTTVRPSTVCGYSKRQRLDLTVNILTNHAINKGKITIYGGEQRRPNIHIKDMIDVYLFLLKQPIEKIHQKIYNVGYENYKIKEIAEMVKKIIDDSLPIEVTSTNDIRSYHISSKKIENELGFTAKNSIEKAILDLKNAFDLGLVPDPINNKKYYNIKTMQEINLK